MLKIFLLFSFFHVVQSGQLYCPEKFELVNDECRGNVSRVYEMAEKLEQTAIAKCKEVVSFPIAIHSEEDNSYWKDRVDKSAGYIILGLVCNPDTNAFEWADGSELDFKPSSYPKELDSFNCNSYSYYAYFLNSSGSWATFGGIYIHADVWCVTQPSRVPFPYNDGCDGFDEDNEDGVCYMIGEKSESWMEAQMNCRKLGANLASIHNVQENSFVRRVAVSKGAVSGLFLGASMSKETKKFEWVDESQWDYENFYPGFPMPGVGDCLAMDTSTADGQWMNTDCTGKLPVACIRHQQSLADPTCSTGPWKEKTIITTPGFPYSSYTPCDFFLTVDEGKKIEMEVVYLDANASDSLTIFDGFLGGNIIATLTGEVKNTTYTSTSNLMRVSWQSNSKKNAMGLAMSYHGIFKR